MLETVSSVNKSFYITLILFYIFRKILLANRIDNHEFIIKAIEKGLKTLGINLKL